MTAQKDRRPRVGKPHCGTLSHTDLQDKLHHLSVHQPVYRLPVDMRDEVPLTKASLTCWTPILHVLSQGKGKCSVCSQVCSVGSGSPPVLPPCVPQQSGKDRQAQDGEGRGGDAGRHTHTMWCTV